MHVHKRISALRGNPAPQQRAQQALECAKHIWTTGEGAGILADLALYDRGAPLDACRQLDAQISGGQRGPIERLIAAYLEIMAEHPLAHVPARHHLAHGIGTLQLAERGNASLSLVLHEPSGLRLPPPTVSFADVDRHEIVLAGEGSGRLFDWNGVDGTPPQDTPLSLQPGVRLHLSGLRHAKQVRDITRSLVLLRLSRTPPSPQPSCEVRLLDGRIIHRAAGDRDESRREIAMALLTAMGRTDGLLHCLALTRNGPDPSRWQALRHCLAMDAAAGFARLSAMADDTQDSLHQPAEALRKQLVELHPQLVYLEYSPCPA